MISTEALERQLANLNDQQRKAVETIDGALLVIAGPGTGKTQLLSLRAANILDKRDVQPGNILCLTYTDAGAEAMKKRLVELVGRDAYGIDVSTFHGFAAALRSTYPEYFTRGASGSLISRLQKSKTADGILKRLSVDNLFYSADYKGVNSGLAGFTGFIDRFNQSGLSSDGFRAINRQTIACIDYLEEHTDILRLASVGLKGTPKVKGELCDAFEAAVELGCRSVPSELRQSVISTPGIYVPFASYLRDLVRETELIDEKGKTAGFQELRKVLFVGKGEEVRRFKDRQTCEKALAAVDAYDEYQGVLDQEGLYDYEDMVTDTIEALETSTELRQRLSDRYRYIQVDEFQDTNGSQLRIVDLLTQDVASPNIMAVGDDDQAIMRFQGASIACIAQFQERYHPENIVLKINYRSTPSIVSLGQEIAAQIENRLPASATDKCIVAFRETDEQTEFAECVFEAADIEYFELARDIRARIDEGFIEDCKDPDEAIAILATKHDCLKRLIPYLRHFDIPFTYSYTSEVFQMESMQTLLALLRFVVAYAAGRAEKAEAQLPQIVASPEIGVGHEECVRFALYARREHHGHWMDALAAYGNSRFKKLHDRLVGWSGKVSTSPVRALIFEIANPLIAYWRQVEDLLALAEFNAGIRALLRFVEGELASARLLGRALRLSDVVAGMDEAHRYDVSIDASISVGRPGAVRLSTAHSSKGLEFDLVYLLDSDDGTWHSSSSKPSLFAANLLIGDSKDDDDARRLLFVAITRAKRRLAVYRAGKNTTRELQGLVESAGTEPSIEEMASIIETSWRDFYALDTPTLRPMLGPDLTSEPLSASVLNAFVEYEEEHGNSEKFTDRRLRLPEEPSLILDYGTKVHAFLEDYVNHVLGAKDRELASLASAYRQDILWMDYPEDELRVYAGRFDRIVDVFVPWLAQQTQGRLVTEAKVTAIVGESGVPLFGRCDLLMVDDDNRTIKVIDYKTGFRYSKKTPTTSYERQLRFYRLLLERSSEYEGYRVVESVDCYVEPEKGSAAVLHPPVTASVSDDEIARLEKLIEAVWKRIQECRFDTTAFEESDIKADALARNVCNSGRAKKNVDRRLIQEAYEEWLMQG